VSWSAVLLALLVSHLVGDLLFQTEWQAVNKVGGFGDATARRALLHHLGLYMCAFVPALVWIGAETSPARAVLVAAVVAVPHILIDDGHLVSVWLRNVKRAPSPALGLRVAVDQTFHVVCLLVAALIAVA
jgi:Protein of unknown function (DUF3307)